MPNGILGIEGARTPGGSIYSSYGVGGGGGRGAGDESRGRTQQDPLN